jgi:hypothetical protein
MSTLETRLAKRVCIADATLHRAARLVGADVAPFDPGSSLKMHNLMHVDGRPVVLERMELLLERVTGRNLPGGFWRDLMRAAEALELPDRLADFEERFQEALRSAASRSPRPGA